MPHEVVLMSRPVYVLAALVIVLTLLTGGSVLAQDGHAEAAAVRAVVARYVDAREGRDAARLAALFAEDADQLVSSGEWRRGREAVVSGGLASSARSAGARTIEVETVRFATPDVAIADGRYEIGAAAGAPARRMWTTFVMVKRDGAWRISAIRNMRPAE
jgi:uncharacterized protein (TIGR02246 family)